jgi:hypothetical protein
MLYSATVTDHLLNTLFSRFCSGLMVMSWWTQEKKSLPAWSVVLSLPTHLARSARSFCLCPSNKKQVGKVNYDYRGVQEGAVTTPSVYSMSKE